MFSTQIDIRLKTDIFVERSPVPENILVPYRMSSFLDEYNFSRETTGLIQHNTLEGFYQKYQVCVTFF